MHSDWLKEDKWLFLTNQIASFQHYVTIVYTIGSKETENGFSEIKSYRKNINRRNQRVTH